MGKRILRGCCPFCLRGLHLSQLQSMMHSRSSPDACLSQPVIAEQTAYAHGRGRGCFSSMRTVASVSSAKAFLDCSAADALERSVLSLMSTHLWRVTQAWVTAGLLSGVSGMGERLRPLHAVAASFASKISSRLVVGFTPAPRHVNLGIVESGFDDAIPFSSAAGTPVDGGIVDG